MTISVGDTLPGGTVLTMAEDGPTHVDLGEKFTDRKVVLFGLPGAFTGVCTTAHLPSFIRTREQFDAKGVDEVICISVNDPFVMDAWSKETGAGEAGITMLGDAEGAYVAALGLDFSAPPVGLINRSKRFALYAEDGIVKRLEVEESPGQCTVSAGDSLLEKI
ncbi:peroxiredoxin [Celeribacter indicus]|uniref:Glutathione-dependent peroxiredoxin n=1 Tax=Celeribacter indicus TaxID=1208324 RepID=A0A0B5DVS1_9RHOB|nr:peroxiredoxin [Celeribacter indicus]AJE45270.1 anti-oxidant AhpCTSA family protein [Celeribacter indicus]SDX21079.1 Peroxiredoxin [Celeribacter indicus]